MTMRMFLRQLFRGKIRAAAAILLLYVTVGFFAMSVNLYQSSVSNLALVDGTFSTIAVMELYGDVDKYGNLVDPGSPEYEGNFSVAVEDYDLTPIVTAAGVESYDLRSRYAAYLPRTIALKSKSTAVIQEDVIRFRLKEDHPVMIPIRWENGSFGNKQNLQVEVISCCGCYQYTDVFFCNSVSALWRKDKERDRAAVRRLNGTDEDNVLILYPEREYALFTWTASMQYHPDTGKMTGRGRIYPYTSSYYFRNFRVQYSGNQEYLGYDREETFFPILFWEDVENDPELLAQFQEAQDNLEISLGTFPVTLTNDFSSIPAVHLGGVYLTEGREITTEEYQSGAKVAVISQTMAELQDWKVGDTLEMNFYQFPAMINSETKDYIGQYCYNPETQGFFTQGVYEIVGIYGERELTGDSSIAESTVYFPKTTIFVPARSVDRAASSSSPQVHGNLLTLRLKNGTINDFLSEMDARGVTAQKDGGYQPKFTFYDQGYSLIQPGLEAMQGTARLLLGLSAALLVATVILLAYFFAQSQKHSVGIFRMLGGRKASAFAAVLTCALILTLFGATAGGLIGHGLSSIVGRRILTENLAQSKEAAEFSAYLLAGGEPEIELSAAADIHATLFSAGAGAALFLLLTAIFTLSYLPKEPRALLPGKQ